MNNIYLYLSNGVNPNKLNWDGRAMRTHEEIWIGAVKWHHRELNGKNIPRRTNRTSTRLGSIETVARMATLQLSEVVWGCEERLFWVHLFSNLFFFGGGQRPNQENTDSVSQMFDEIRLPSGKRLHNYGKIHNFQWENPLSLWPCSLAMLNYQRVYIYNVMWYYGIAWDVYNGNIIYTYIYIYIWGVSRQLAGNEQWLLGGLEDLDYFSILGMSSSQQTNIFQRGWNHQPGYFSWFCLAYFMGYFTNPPNSFSEVIIYL